MTSLKELAFGDLDSELGSTRRVLERLPEARFDWQPHEKSTALGVLGTHIANVLGMQVKVLRDEGVDFATHRPAVRVAESSDALLAMFDTNAAAVREALDALEEAEFDRDWTLRFGERVIFTRPRLVAFRTFGLSHIAHHRGQLSVYLRLLDVPVPSIYGPSADEPL